MKTYTFIIVMLLASVLCNAQLTQNNGITTDKADFEGSKFSNQKSPPAWEVTFDEVTPVWTIGNNTGTTVWEVSDTTPSHGFTSASYGGEVPPLWLYMGWQYVHDYSDSGGNFAWIDGISALLGLTTPEILDAYVQFDNIDLSAVANPKLTFFQNYKALNQAFTYIDFSTNGGTTWTTVEVNSDVEGNAFGDTFYELVATSYIANQADVSIRFRWQTTTNEIGGYGYGWSIDDIRIIEDHSSDLSITDARVNFFEYINYTLPETSGLYHHSSHYGKIPKSVFNSDLAKISFNVEVSNNGDYALTPAVSVKVFDPEMNEIFSNIISATTSIPPHSKDTIDLTYPEFHPGTDAQIGLYTIEFRVELDSEVDKFDNDNFVTAYFEITNGVYSRALFEPVESESPANYELGGTDGDLIGSTFMFFESASIDSMDVFISENSMPGAYFKGRIMLLNELFEEVETIGESYPVEIEETDIGTWKTIYFTNVVAVEPLCMQGQVRVLAAIELYYGEDDNIIYVGYDKDSNYSMFSTMFNFMNDYQFQFLPNSCGGLGINLHLGSTSQIPSNIAAIKSIEIYPNPVAEILNIKSENNICKAVIYDLSGRMLTSVTGENISGISTQDISAGSYLLICVDEHGTPFVNKFVKE